MSRKLDGASGRSNGVAGAEPAGQIPPVSPISTIAPPYALATPSFRFRALAALAARAPIGPAREVALAWFVCGRLLDGVAGPGRLSASVRSARATAARTWLAGASLPAACRPAFARLVDLCGEGDPDHVRLRDAVAEALRSGGEHLDPAARSEIEGLAPRP